MRNSMTPAECDAVAVLIRSALHINSDEFVIDIHNSTAFDVPAGDWLLTLRKMNRAVEEEQG